MLDLRYKTILRVAIPLMGSSFIQSIVLLTDSAFLSRYDTIAYDAVGNGGLIYISLFMALRGLSEGGQIIMARRIGEQREHELGNIVGSAIGLHLMLAVILFVCIGMIVPHIIREFVADQVLGQIEYSYVYIRSYGFFPGAVMLVFNAYFMARGNTKIVLLGAVTMAISNVLLDYLLINGNHGFPEMGASGAAVASLCSDWIGMVFMTIAFVTGRYVLQQTILQSIRFQWNTVKRLLRVGAPILLQSFVALLTWTIFFFWIEQKGLHELTVSQNIRSLYFLAFIPVWGFGATTKTYISQYLGKGDHASLKTIIWRVQVLTLIFLLLIFHGAALYPETLISLINPNQAYLQDSGEILRFVFGSILLYGITSTYFQTISGSGNTRFTFYIELLSVTLYTVFAYLFIKVWNFDIYWIWSVEYIYFATMGGAALAYLSFFDWKNKTV